MVEHHLLDHHSDGRQKNWLPQRTTRLLNQPERTAVTTNVLDNEMPAVMVGANKNSTEY